MRKKVLIVSANYYEDISKQLEMWATKHLDNERLKQLKLKDNESIFFVCDNPKDAQLFAGKVRDKLCLDLNLLNKNAFEFCWIVDFPMYEIDEKTTRWKRYDDANSIFFFTAAALLIII